MAAKTAKTKAHVSVKKINSVKELEKLSKEKNTMRMSGYSFQSTNEYTYNSGRQYYDTYEHGHVDFFILK